MGIQRAVVIAAALVLSAGGLNGLRRGVPSAAPPSVAAAAAVEEPAPAPRVPRPGHWWVKVDGWYIELDEVAALPAPDLDPEPLDPPLLSPYDHLIARYAEAAGIDWRLIAAVIYEESRFQPGSVSNAGAIGLMQVREIAARDVGEAHFTEPEDNIRTGVRYLQRLAREFAAAAGRDRLALMLAAYNMGIAHVQDAQRLARRFGYDPLRWDGAMDVMVSLLEEPQVYGELPAGFAQGRAVVDYVDRVLRRHASYRRDLPALPPGRMLRTAATTPG